MPTRLMTYRQLLQRQQRPEQQRVRVNLSVEHRSPTERGYDVQWQKLAKAYRQAHPLCEHCEAKGYLKPATETDHIRPFTGLADPLRLDWDNLQALCNRCHSRKTATEDGGFGRLRRTQRQEPQHG